MIGWGGWEMRYGRDGEVGRRVLGVSGVLGRT